MGERRYSFSPTNGSEWSLSHSDQFITIETDNGVHCTCENKNSLFFLRPPVIEDVVSHFDGIIIAGYKLLYQCIYVFHCLRPHNEELHNLYSYPSIIRIIKSRRMRWAGYVARMGEKKNACRILVRNPEGTRPLGRLNSF
jgi:hypothetical protein